MRTNIMLDDCLLTEAFKYAEHIKTKKDLVNLALEEFVNSKKRKDLRDLKGKISFSDNYNHKDMRTTT